MTINHQPDSSLDLPECETHQASQTLAENVELNQVQLDAITTMLKALADSNRLQLLLLLQQCDSPLCVSEIATQTGDKITTVSNRLKQLHDAGLVNKRRDGQHILYTLQDAHVEALLSNLIAHASHV
ncbi:ArsR/SmtB family transcription factor [Psychrobacter sp. I-STPA6b]|uniref:ArsR/SmtB family transcription factor n=1 Tax=Psychrobacter sp. I-STPA6b TaxID=2585718 RepID=UPI001D0C0AC5|nr:metalloregulator ArsR/SmtB family transcription factor [Psychrobacter sp. I-STPA6b]